MPTRPARLPALLLLLLLASSLTASHGCGDEGEDEPSRVGEACAANEDCREGLACLEQEGRCVVLCEVGSEDCGPGIDCEPAGEVGFCPLPPDPDSDT